MYNSFFKSVLAFVAVLSLVSCDKDFNEIGSGIVGDDHFGMETKFDVPVKATTVGTGPVESRNLPVNPLGVYKNTVFGTTTASFATQVQLKSTNPIINPELNPEVTEVYLSVPYFARHTETQENGVRVYELDSVYGGGKFNLQVYRSGYYMRDIAYDGETQEAQLFYTDEGPVFEAMKVGQPLNNRAGATYENTEFFFNASEQEIIEFDEDGEQNITKIPPGMRLKLDNEAFQQAIIEAPAAMLNNNTVFKNYFRGLYFKADEIPGNSGALAMLDFKKGSVSIKYEHDQMVEGVMTRVSKTYVLEMTGNTVSLLENNNSSDYNTALSQTTGDNPRLWIKGGEGSVATIDLFGTEDLDGNHMPDVLDQIRSEEWLINEANLTFYIDKDRMAEQASNVTPTAEPQRVYLYDVTNRRPIYDYSIDGTSSGDPKRRKSIYNGMIERENVEGGKGIRYKVRITNYINMLVKNADSTNLKLGLSVTEDISTVTMVQLKNPNATLRNVIPTASVMSPLGTVLHGTTSEEAGKRLRLEIYYTKPE